MLILNFWRKEISKYCWKCYDEHISDYWRKNVYTHVYTHCPQTRLEKLFIYADIQERHVTKLEY